MGPLRGQAQLGLDVHSELQLTCMSFSSYYYFHQWIDRQTIGRCLIYCYRRNNVSNYILLPARPCHVVSTLITI